MAARITIVGEIDRAALAFTVGRDPTLDLALVEADCIGTAAHVSMLARMRGGRLFTNDERLAVIRELIEIMRDGRRGEFAISMDDQDVHLAIERRLTARLGDPGRRVHTARSRNDQIAVDLRIHARAQLHGIIHAAIELADALALMGRRGARAPMVGRTHLQPAMPSSVGLWATAHAEALLDDLRLIRAVYELNNLCPLGAAAGYGVPLPIDRHFTASALGFTDPLHNVLHAVQSRGRCESAILSALTQAMLTLGRLAEDLTLFSMPEFGYVALPADFCTGSSIMPQKRNPDVCELLRAKAGAMTGRLTAVLTILKGLPSGYNRDMQECKAPFLEGLDETLAALEIATRLITQTTFDAKALRRAFSPGVFAADRALELVVEGVPFRDAYNTVKASLSEQCAGDADAALAARTHAGATAGLDFDHYRKRIAAERRWIRTERRRVHRAIGKLLGMPYPSLTEHGEKRA